MWTEPLLKSLSAHQPEFQHLLISSAVPLRLWHHGVPVLVPPPDFIDAFSEWFPSFLFLLPAVSPPCFHTVYLPPIFYILSHALLSFPSLPSAQICFDSLSPPGLNHQGPLVGPNQGPVSPQRGFCLLTVETNEPPPRCFDILKRSLPRFARRDECQRRSVSQSHSSLKHPRPHC